MMPATLARTGVPLVTTAPTTTRRGPFPMPGPPGPWRSLAAAGTVALALAGCSSTPPPHEVPDEAHGDRFALHIEASTTSWRLVDEGPGDTCLWHGPTYTVRDGAGVVLDTGPITTHEDDEGTTVGVQLASEESCVLSSTVDVPPAGVYDVQVSTLAPDRPRGRAMTGAGETFTGDAMITHEDAATGQAVTVTLEGPAPMY